MSRPPREQALLEVAAHALRAVLDSLARAGAEELAQRVFILIDDLEAVQEDL